jgi:hypothetical protein
VVVLSQVMGPLVENLESLGYTDGVNLLTAPYDWRLPYFYLEVRNPRRHRITCAHATRTRSHARWPLWRLHTQERDGYFTWLMTAIEKMAKREKKPVRLARPRCFPDGVYPWSVD